MYVSLAPVDILSAERWILHNKQHRLKQIT